MYGKCIYCNEIFDLNKKHFGIEFINGYPTPCRMNGKMCMGWDDEDKKMGNEWVILTFIYKNKTELHERD